MTMTEQTVLARPMLSGGAAERSGAFSGYLRDGSGTLELKAFTGVTGAEGGFAIPREIDAMIDRTLKSASPLRAIANVVQVGSAGYRKLVTSGGTPSGWAAETAARPVTASPVFNEIAPPMGDLYANPAASQAMLDDAAFDVEAWLADEIAAEFAKAEGTAFVSGDGVNKPKGFLTGPTAATGDTVRAFGTIQYLASGAAGDFAANPQERLIDLVQALRAPYRQGASWVMNASTLARIRKMKTADGAFLWAAGLAVGQPDTLLGYPVVESEDMPDIAANSLAIAFGNFRAGYLIAERTETQILRDPYSNKPFVHFYATLIVDLLLAGTVERAGETDVPAAPLPGQCWIVGAGAGGAWSGQADAVAAWTSGGWRFLPPVEGRTWWSRGDAVEVRYTAGAWRRGPAIGAPAGGATVDAEARAAIGAIVQALEQHGLVEPG